jgi:hypothetical protein
MQRGLLLDPLVRVLVAVEQGLSHRKAGERFEVGAASISPWRALEQGARPIAGWRPPIRTCRGAQRHDLRAYPKKRPTSRSRNRDRRSPTKA